MWAECPIIESILCKRFGRIAGRPPVIIECDSDKQAIEKARQMLDEQDIEVWDRARVVARLKAPKTK